MKTAKAVTLVAIVICPDCDASIMAPMANTYDWTPDTIDDSLKSIVCGDCGTRSKIPAIKFS
jgi:hypothetical protein